MMRPLDNPDIFKGAKTFTIPNGTMGDYHTYYACQ